MCNSTAFGNSKTSSTLITRSLAGIAAHKQLSSDI